jgi:signal transduction histidine kinase/CheY-like chemotaxis protein
MKFYQRIRPKLILVFLLITLVPVMTIGLYALQTVTNALHEQELNAQSAIVKNLKQDIQAFFTSVQNDLLFLSQSQSLKQYLNEKNNPSLALEKIRQTLEQEFLTFSRTQNLYEQIAYLNENGQEMVRIEQRENHKSIIALEQLQNQANHEDFTKTMLLDEREIFVSPSTQNQDRKHIDTPHKSVIRYATPVFYQNGKRAGIVMTHVNIEPLLQNLGTTLLVNQAGYYLAHPDVNKRWRGDLESSNTLAQDDAILASTIRSKRDGHLNNKPFISTWKTVSIPNLGDWTVIIQRADDDLYSPLFVFRITFVVMVIIALFVSVMIALFISRMMTHPLEQFTHLIEQVRAGYRDIQADIKETREWKRLGKRFNTMLKAIKKSESKSQKALQDAQTANLAKSRFLANMSHELRTPLNAIIGYSEMLQEELDALGEAELSNDIEKIYSAGKNLLNLINDILDLSKIEAGKMELYIETFYLPNMVDDVVHTINPLLIKNQDTLEVHYHNELGEMRADLTKLRQVLLKLLSNASQLNEQKEVISLNISREIDEKGGDKKDWIVFRVEDNGIGLAEKQKAELIQMFAKSEAPTSHPKSGSGLGLAITNHFVKMMGGELKVESQLGEGSTFIVHLPAIVSSTQETLNLDSQDIAVLEEGGIVLVIDDDAEAREMLQRYLSKSGYQVEVAESGEEGLRLAKKILPDIITLDVMMPNMDGWEVLSHLKADAELAPIPVIILSMMEDKSMGYSLGASDYLLKPITREQLSKVLQKYHFAQNESARLVMIIDDDPVNRDMVARMLRKAGYRVGKVEDGRIALNYIQKKQPDLILLDLQMPEMDGFEFVARLHQLYEDSIPVILMTAKDITKEDRLRLSDNVVKIFQKGSYSRKELLTQVKQLFSS